MHPAYGPPLGVASLRATPEAFQVEEVLGFEAAGEGEHLLVNIQKRGLTTQQAAQRLAKAWGVRARNIGWAGLKDKHAVTRQTLSLPWPIKRELPTWDDDDDSLRVREISRHNRKLRPGSHAANRFVVDCELDGVVDTAALQTRVAEVQAGGMPNGFGAQRFGRDGDNVEQFMAIDPQQPCPGILISAARSAVFNAVLNARIAAGNWATVIRGDWMMLDGSHSGFAADPDDSSLLPRLASMDVHVSGPMPGLGNGFVSDDAAALEAAAASPFAAVVERLCQRKVAGERRALRVRVTDCSVSAIDERVVRLAFQLPPGSFATTFVDQFFTQKAV